LEVNTVEKINTAIVPPEKTTDALLLEVVSTLPEASKLMILGVARGIALSASIPVAG
jgi:hypothetical protein